MSGFPRAPAPFGPPGQGPPGLVPPPFPVSAGRRKHPLDFCGPLYKRRWLGIATFAAVMSIVGFYVTTEVRQYLATVELLIQTEGPKIVAFKEVTEQGHEALDFFETQFRLLQSRSLAKRTLDELKLWRHPDFGGPKPAATGKPTWRQRVGGAMRTVVAWAQRPFRSEAAGEPAAPSETAAQTIAIDAFLQRLSVSPYRFSRLAEVSFQSTDPVLAARVANTISRLYIQQQLEFRTTTSREATEWLNERIAEQRRFVEESEAAVQAYRAKHGAVSVDDRQAFVTERLAGLIGATTQARTSRIEKEAAYRQLSAVRDRKALRSMPAVVGNPRVQMIESELISLQRQQAQLAERFGELHPEMIKIQTSIRSAEARLDTEIDRLIEAAHNEFVAAQQQERSLSGALDVQQRESLGIDQKAIEYGVLVREAESNRQVFESLLQRAKETDVTSELRSSHIRIVDPAEVPLAPLSRRRQTVIVGTASGAIAAFALIFLIEFFDRRLKSPDDLRTDLGLHTLGLVPVVSKKLLRRITGLVSRDAPPRLAEAFRAIRTSIVFALDPDEPRLIAITSPEPGEGKTFVSSNIAVVLAQTGGRTLLVDGDMRRSRVHEVFGERSEPGLSNVLSGQIQWRDAVRTSDVPHLSVMPGGTRCDSPAELLASRAFKELLTTAGREFDWVLIDTPPVLAVTDACLIANVVSGVVFVVGAEMTGRHVAQTALEQLSGAKGRMIGAILNRIDFKRNAYYYSSYGRRDYGQYYHQKAA